MAHGVVAKVARQTAAKPRQARAQRDLEALLIRRHKVQRVAGGGLDDLTVAHDLGQGVGAEAAGTHQCARRQANEAVAAKTLAAHHGFEQKAVFAAVA
jgi:hypothetical protein